MNSELSPASGSPGVALLFEDTELGAHLRKALVDAGARIVHEGPATQATREDLAGNGAEVVVVNLDATVENHLDALYEIFDEDQQRIVFNDAQVSSGLSGWDQARWARHLAAKLLDARDVDPPRPEQARGIEIHPAEAMLSEAVPAARDETPESATGAQQSEPTEPEEKGLSERDSAELTAELEALLAEDGDLLDRGDPEPGTPSAAAPPVDFELDGIDMPPPELDAIESEPTSAADGSVEEPESREVQEDPATSSADETAAWSAEDDAGSLSLGDTLAAMDDATDEPRLNAESSADFGTDFDAELEANFDANFGADFEADSETDSDTSASATEQTPSGLELDDVPELTDLQIAPAEELHEADLAQDIPDAQPPQDSGHENPLELEAEAEAESTPQAAENKVAPPQAPDWDLVDFDDAAAEDTDVRAESSEEIEHPSAFGIDKVSAADYLSPEGGEGDDTIEPHFSLELEPIEQAIAPKMHESTGYEMSLENTGNHIHRVAVIGTGSEDEALASLEAFLQAIMKTPEAAFLAVVHQHSGTDLQALAQRLDAVTRLHVRVAEDLARVRHGELLLVPAGRQVTLGYNGRVQLLPVAEQPLADPSIDLTLTQVAQEMGENVLAVVLAGDAVDALAGVQAVIDRGGRVWALDPADCTANTMVSVICEEQLVQCTGTPQALAARLLEEFS
jgi:chemotaxis response regulator CheB